MDNVKPGGDMLIPKPVVPPASPKPPTPKLAAPPPPAAGIDDIFFDMKEVSAAPRPVAGPATAPSMARTAEKMAEKTVVETPRQGFKKILITIGIIVLFAGIVAGGGYWVYTNFLQPKPLNPNLNLNVDTNLNVAAPPPEATPPTAVQQAPQSALLDSDNDGLTDEQELAAGTDHLNPDTDGDGLFDGEEVNVYKTSPLNPDTDGDMYKDGAEVQSGYDPKGPGKLIRIPAGQ